MEKVKITAERADAIESYLSREHFVKDDLIEEHFDRRGKWDNEFFALNEMSSYALAKALYIGYEVEPEFKVRDWITYDEDKYGSGDKEVVWIEEIKYSNYWNEECAYWNAGGSSLPLSKIRHATPSEIAEEKERRWWASHGREPWDLREDDILEYLGDLLIVDSFDSEDVCFRRSKGSIDDYFENLDYVKEHFKVVCFNHDRLDVKTND